MPMRMTILASAVLLTLAHGAAQADDDAADRRAAAAAVLDALHSADMVANIVPSIMGQIRINLTRNDPDLVKMFEAYEPHLQAEADATKPALLDKLVDVYAKTFTLSELRDMLAYYKSPVGQRIIATQATVNHDMLAAARDWGNGVAKVMATDAAAQLQGTQPADPAAAPEPAPAPAPAPAPNP